MEESKFLKQLGLKIRCLLIMAELDSKQLATKTGITRSTLNKIMRGQSNLAILSLKKITDALGTDMKELL